MFRPGFENSNTYLGQTDNLVGARKIGGVETTKSFLLGLMVTPIIPLSNLCQART